MTKLQELITDLKAAGANENTIRLAMNCYELGKADAEKEISDTLTIAHMDGYARGVDAGIKRARDKQ